MGNYQNILVGVDGSEEAEKALMKAIGIAVKCEGRLIIAHVIDTRAYASNEHYDHRFIEPLEEKAKELLQACKEKAEQAGVENVQTIIERGSPRAAMSKTIAAAYEAGIVVAGATGQNAVERLFLGSVSEAIARKAPCDVLIVRS